MTTRPRAGLTTDKHHARIGTLGAAATAAAAAAATTAGLTLLSVYALAVEPYQLRLEQRDIFCPNLPHRWDGVTVLLLTDLHIGRWGRREKLLADLLDTLPETDLAVLGGDQIQYRGGVVPASRLLRDHVRARHGRFVIWGNAEHKISATEREKLRRRHETDGLTVLINEWQPLTIHGETITIAGTDDPYYGHADLKKTLRGAPDDQFRLLLSHSPQLAFAAARANIDLMLSGHTHGGQVRLPLVGALRTQNPLGRRVDCGVFDQKRLRAITGRDTNREITLYISRGVGATTPPVGNICPRFLCPPEISLLTLRCARPDI